MRVRTSLILSDELMSKIDEIAGEKQRRSIVVETALREFVAREEKKRAKTVATDDAANASLPAAKTRDGRPAAVKAAPARPASAQTLTRSERKR